MKTNKLLAMVVSIFVVTITVISLSARDARAAWGAAAPMDTARAQHTATLINNGQQVLVAGGTNGSNALATAQLYNTASNSWSSVNGSMSTARYGHTATLFTSGVNNGKVLVAGGMDDTGTALASAELYNPATKTWGTAGTMSTPRSGHTATLLNNGKVLVVGGEDDNGVTLNSAELYDPATNTWSAVIPTSDPDISDPIAAMSVPRRGHTATLLIGGTVLVAGGTGDPNAGDTAEIYDPTQNQWLPTADFMNSVHYQHTATKLNITDNKVLVAGGFDLGSFSASASAEVYDPQSASSVWTAVPDMATARYQHTATLLTNGKVLVVGGQDSNSNPLNSAELFDPTAKTWGSAGTMASASWQHTATALTSGQVLVTGGTDGSGPLARAELYSATAPVADKTAPVVSAFTFTTPSNSQSIPVTITATDNVGVTGYLVTTTSTKPTAGLGGWNASSSFTYTATFTGSKTLYAWAKDAASNVSAAKTASVVIDTTKPVVSAFTVNPYANPQTKAVTVKSFTVSDNVKVASYLINQSGSAPAPDDAGWKPTKPTSYQLDPGTPDGPVTLYAWVKDTAGNVSAAPTKSAVTTLDTTPPTFTFTVPAAGTPGYSKSRTIAVTFSDIVETGSGVAGYMVTKVAHGDPVSAPLATLTTWKTTAPTSFAVTADGWFDLYGWVKDKAGNVSAAGDPQWVVVDATAPVVSPFKVSPLSGLTVRVDSFTASDTGSGLAGYLITESSAKPAYNATGWSNTPGDTPHTYTFATTGGAKTLYAWAKDNAGNVSAGKSASVTIPNTSLSGKVTDGVTGKAIANVVVSVYNAATGVLVKSAKTSSTGTYTVASLAKGVTYKVFFDGSALTQNYARKFYNGGMVDFEDATLVPIDALSGAVTGKNIQLSAGGTISGTVTTDGTTAAPGIRVSVFKSYGAPVFGATATTGSDGRYSIKGLATGNDYRIQFDGGTAYAVSYNGVQAVLDRADHSYDVKVPSSGNDATLPAATPASISGQVTDGSSAAIPNVTVSAYTTNGKFVKSTFSAADGTYSLDGLTDATDYTVFFDGAAMGYARAFSNNEPFDISSAAAVTAPQPGIDVALPAGGSISGTVTDNASAAIPEVLISLYQTTASLNPIFGARRVTDAAGNYTLNGLPSGDYYIKFDGSMAGYVPAFSGGVTDLGSAAPVTVTAPANTASSDTSAALAVP